MTIKAPIILAGAVALALGAAPFALGQQQPNTPPPSSAQTPASTTVNSPASSPAMMTSGNSQSMSSPTAMTSGRAGNMHRSNVNLSKSEILRIQRALKGMGYYLQVDGAWGQGTIDDIKDVQFKNGLNVTGRPDAGTLRALGLKGNRPAAGTYNQSSSGSRRNNGSMNNSMNGSMNSRGSNAMPSTMTGSSQAGNMNNTHGTSMNASNNARVQLSKQQITQIQSELKQQGYNVQVTGTWDQQSRQALMQFQRKNGNHATGYPTGATLQSLGLMRNPSHSGAAQNRTYTSATVTSNGGNMNMPASGMNSNPSGMNNGMNNMRGSMHRMAKPTKTQIMHVQMKLSQKGYQVDQNGQWGNKTRSALLRFQKQNGLTTTGYPDMKTRQALGITNPMWQSWAESGTMAPTMGTS